MSTKGSQFQQNIENGIAMVKAVDRLEPELISEILYLSLTGELQGDKWRYVEEDNNVIMRLHSSNNHISTNVSEEGVFL